MTGMPRIPIPRLDSRSIPGWEKTARGIQSILGMSNRTKNPALAAAKTGFPETKKIYFALT